MTEIKVKKLEAETPSTLRSSTPKKPKWKGNIEGDMLEKDPKEIGAKLVEVEEIVGNQSWTKE